MKRKYTSKFILLAVLLFGCLIALYFQIYYKKTSVLNDIITSITTCDKGKQDAAVIKQCLKSTAHSLIQTHSLEEIMDTLEKNPTLPLNSLTTECHIFTHYLGQAAYKKYKDLPNSLSSCNEYCYSGCYHGVTPKNML